jgi:hypothetical protein
MDGEVKMTVCDVVIDIVMITSYFASLSLRSNSAWRRRQWPGVDAEKLIRGPLRGGVWGWAIPLLSEGLGAVPPENFSELTGRDAILAYFHAIFHSFISVWQIGGTLTPQKNR